MDNPKTRADLLADKAEIERQLEAMPEHEWKVGDRVCCVGTVENIYTYKNYTDIEFDNDGGDTSTINDAALIPAADMIPRAEHERLIAEANHKTVMAHIIPELDELLNSPMPTRMGVPVAVTDAEPVGYANFYHDPFADDVWKTKDDALKHACTNASETAVPLYRHPAPAMPAQPVTVASQSVVETLKTAIDQMAEELSETMAAANEVGMDITMPMDVLRKTVNDCYAALAKITVLPEPDEFWAERMRTITEQKCVLIDCVGKTIGVGISDIPSFCAALISKGNEVEAGK